MTDSLKDYICLTMAPGGYKVWVNMAQVEYFFRKYNQDYTTIVFEQNDRIDVVETPVELLQKEAAG